MSPVLVRLLTGRAAYPIVAKLVQSEPKRYAVHVPDFPAVQVRGLTDSSREAFELGVEAVGRHVAELLHADAALPEPTPIGKVREHHEGFFCTALSGLRWHKGSAR